MALNQFIVPAKISGLKEYTIEYRPPCDIEIFGKSFAAAGKPSKAELAELKLDYPNYNVYIYSASIPERERNFLPIIGHKIRQLIGVKTKTYIVIDCSILFTQIPELKSLEKPLFYNEQIIIQNRIQSLLILLLRNINLEYYHLDRAKIQTTKHHILIPDMGLTNREIVMSLILDSLSLVTVDDILQVYNNF